MAAVKAKTQIKKLVKGSAFCQHYEPSDGDRAELSILPNLLEALKIERPVQNAVPIHPVAAAMPMPGEQEDSEAETLFHPSLSSP